MGLYTLQGQTAIMEGITECLRSQGEHLAGSWATKTELESRAHYGWDEAAGTPGLVQDPKECHCRNGREKELDLLTPKRELNTEGKC